MNREMRRLQEAEERRAKKRGRAPQKRRAQQGERKPLWKRLITFMGEVRIELKRVSWPTRTQMVAFTTVTLITTTAITLYIFGLDLGMGKGILWLLERGS